MLWNTRKLLSELQIKRCLYKINVAYIAINVFKNVRILRQKAAYTEGYRFWIQFELFIHKHQIVHQILGKLE